MKSLCTLSCAELRRFLIILKSRKKSATIKSLAFCSEEIEAQYEEWLESQVGKNCAAETYDKTDDDSMFSQEAIAGHLENISTSLGNAKLNTNQGLAETLERVLHRLSELQTSFTDAEHLEEDLTHLEKLIDESLLENAETDELAKLQAETEKELHNYKKQMEAEIYQRTFDLMLLKKFREKVEIPRLSLFYL